METQNQTIHYKPKINEEDIINHYRTLSYRRLDDEILKCYIAVFDYEVSGIVPNLLRRSRFIRSRKNNQDLAKIIKHFSEYNFHKLNHILKYSEGFIDIEKELKLNRENFKDYLNINIRIKEKTYFSLQDIIRIYDKLKEEKIKFYGGVCK